MIQLTHEQTRWELADDFAPLLSRVLAAPAEVVKESAAKLVAAHAVNGRRFFVKRYRHGAVPLRPLKFFFKPSQARSEWRWAAILEEKRVPIVRHVALGERWTWRGLEESVLITEAFEGRPLDSSAQEAFAAVCAFVHNLARHQVVHRDFHSANLLLSHAGELRLLDLHGLEVAPGAAPEQLAADMLAQLCIHLPLPVAPEIAAAGLQLRKRALWARSRRCLKTNRDFHREQTGALHWHVRSAAMTPAMARAMQDADAFLAAARVLKAGRSSTVGGADGIVVKRYNFRRWLRPVKDLFRESRAQAAFRKGYHLELAGIPTARVIAAADERLLGLVKRGFLVMEEIPGAMPLGQSLTEIHRVAAATGRLLARLHTEGFSHRDLKETNVLIDERGHPHLIDLEGLRFEGDVSNETAAANLRRLAEGTASAGMLNRVTLFRFLHAYCRARNLRPRHLFP